MEDDAKFDRWLVEYQAKQARESAALANKQSGGGNKINISKEEYLSRFAKVHGEG